MVWFKNFAGKVHAKYLEKHRQDKKVTKKIDNTMTVVGTMGPAATSIQVFHIFATRAVAGISGITWFGYILVTLCWLAYGFFYKDRALMVVNSLGLCMNVLMLTGYFLYR